LGAGRVRRIEVAVAGGPVLAAELDDSGASAQLFAALPVELSMSRWGDEYYGSLPLPIAAGGKRREIFAVGEIALWPPGNAFCIFFGPTPASHGDEPRMASPGIPLGRIVSGIEPLRRLGAGARMTLRAPAA
jgi:hypothetical protein